LKISQYDAILINITLCKWDVAQNGHWVHFPHNS